MLGDNTQAKHPVTPEILTAIFRSLDMSNVEHIAYWSLFVLAFFSLLRQSNLVPVGLDFEHVTNSSHFLHCRDVTFIEEGALLSVKSSKTIQFHERHLYVVVPAISGSVLCPVLALQLFMSLAPKPKSWPLLSFHQIRLKQSSLRPHLQIKLSSLSQL